MQNLRPLNTKITNGIQWIENKLRHVENNIRFYSAGSTSYGYLSINGNTYPGTSSIRPPRLINVYLSEVENHVDYRVLGFARNTESQSQSSYTVWVNFSINGNVWCHWVYMLI